MNKSDSTELAWATLDAQAIAKLLDRMTPDESGLPARDLCIVRAHAWALVDGLQSLLAGLPKVRVGEAELTMTPASDDDRASESELNAHPTRQLSLDDLVQSPLDFVAQPADGGPVVRPLGRGQGRDGFADHEP
jgi:hypothetical protein